MHLHDCELFLHINFLSSVTNVLKAMISVDIIQDIPVDVIQDAAG